MEATSNPLMPVLAERPSDAQRLFARYFTGFLIDLVVLNLFDEYSDRVSIRSFTISLAAALLLQVLLKLTVALEQWVAEFFKARSGGLMTFLRFFCAWLVLFGSKFVILEAISFVFGDDVLFLGAFHGVVALVIVVSAMLLAEELVVRLYRKLS